MKSMRRLGLVLTVLFLCIIIGNFCIRPALLVFVPLFTLWFMLWDERKYAQHYAERHYDEEEFEEEQYYKEPAEDFYYVTYDHQYHKSA